MSKREPKMMKVKDLVEVLKKLPQDMPVMRFEGMGLYSNATGPMHSGKEMMGGKRARSVRGLSVWSVVKLGWYSDCKRTMYSLDPNEKGKKVRILGIG